MRKGRDRERESDRKADSELSMSSTWGWIPGLRSPLDVKPTVGGLNQVCHPDAPPEIFKWISQDYFGGGGRGNLKEISLNSVDSQHHSFHITFLIL